MSLITLSWFLIIGLSFLFFVVIVPAFPAIHNSGVFTVVAILKIGLTFGLVLVWVGVMVYARRIYVRSRRIIPSPT
ncbi:MAG: hypothetical protein OK422_04575 [Thaumarchaeota archaeon]|nr:hypothetical protein [Nitrososphaerota archaeon]